MTNDKKTLEIIGESVEEAVETGLKELGLTKETARIEILDGGSKGFLGLGTRLAKVRISEATAEAPAMVVPAKVEVEDEVPTSPKVADAETRETVEKVAVEGDAATLATAEKVTQDLLDRMHIRARVSAGYVPPEDENDDELIQIEVQGDDLSILIGRRSETLNALQYIVSLIVAKEAGHWVPLQIDVQGYRARRERQLRLLARRMAEQVGHTGKTLLLEPMPANERRVIHLELRGSDVVLTESVGEEPNRKVSIVPKIKAK